MTVLTKHILWDVSLTVNGVDLSDRVQSVSLAVGQDEVDITPYPGPQKYNAPAAQTVSDVTIAFYQDFSPGKVYATFIALWQNQTVFSIVGKPFSGARAATNPEFTVPVFVKALPLLSGKRGDAHMVPVTCGIGGTLTIATS